jgi:AcrR family transcriptional regulator
LDKDVALKKAALVFCEHGYETTSASDLIASMDISTTSLYTAFGNKEQLFLDTFARIPTQISPTTDEGTAGSRHAVIH